MEYALRFVIVFLWCVGFGFFSVMGYLDDAMTTQKTTAILAGLLAGLAVYGAIEWRPTIKVLPFLRAGWNKLHSLFTRMAHGIRASLRLCARMVQGIRAYMQSIHFALPNIRLSLKSINRPPLRNIRKRYPPTSKPSISSKNP